MKFLTSTGLVELISKIKTALAGKVSTSDVVTAVVVDIDSTPTASSTNLVTSGGVKTAIDAKYTKPVDGIPSTDMTSAVQTSLGKADVAVLTTSQTLSDAEKLQARTNIQAESNIIKVSNSILGG